MEFVLRMLATNKREVLELSPNKGQGVLIVDHTDERSIPIAREFHDLVIHRGVRSHERIFPVEPVVRCANGMVDHLATVFYMVNALQEQDAHATDKDGIGRFRYDRSYQHRYGSILDNLVQMHLDAFCGSVGRHDLQNRNRKTRVFLSHDIDSMHGSFLQDGLWALKHGRPDVLVRLVFNELVRRPGWRNFDRIHRLHDAHDLRSTFFWLATRKRGSNGLRNADYDVAGLTKQIRRLPSNGLHKSCADLSFREELDRLPFATVLNRFHYLRFDLPGSWKLLEDAGMELDASLGFPEQVGFRNNYGLPFRPYDMAGRKPFGFVEVPLHAMDGTLHRYMGLSQRESVNRTIDLLDRHRKNAVISVLWHNTYFTPYKYKGFLDVYKTIIAYLRENGITSITPEEMIQEHGS